MNPNANQGKTVGQIILSNSLTFFNILNICFFVLILAVGSYKNCLFMIVCVLNTVIGIIQEVRTKKTLDSLRLMTQPEANVIRDGMLQEVPVEQLVLDDVIQLQTGDQIPADCTVLKGSIEVNESMLTGESDNVQKQ